MKTLKTTTLLLLTALTFSCAKDIIVPEQQPQTVTSFQFLTNGFTYTIGELATPDSNVYESHTRSVLARNTDSMYVSYNTYLIPSDSTDVEYDTTILFQHKNLFLSDSIPFNMLNPELNKTVVFGIYTITLTNADTVVTTPKGTFHCNRFIVTEDGYPFLSLLCDKDYKYPFIKGAEYDNNKWYYYYDLINN